MKILKKKIISLVLVIMMLAMVAPGRISVSATSSEETAASVVHYSASDDDWDDDDDDWDEEEEGEYEPDKCGKDLKWSFNESDGTLTITGSGKMWDYSYNDHDDDHPEWVYNKTTSQYIADKVKKVVFIGNITSIGDYAFIKCKNLKTIQLPPTLKEIGEGAFAETGITELNLPASVSTVHAPIDNVAYLIEYLYGYDDEFIKLNGSIKNINVDSANPYFSSVNGILYDKQKNTLICCPEGKSGSVAIPASVTKIADGAFTGCSGLTDIAMPDSLTSIGDYVFCCCTALTSINIPDSVNEIGTATFQGCTNLTSIHLPKSLQYIDYDLFEHCSKLKSITIPNSVTSISGLSFRYCQSLTSLTVPNSVTFIGQGAFARCANLKSIIIPKSVEEFEWGFLADSTFEGCDNLRDLYFTGSEEEWKKIATDDEFENILGLNENVTIHYNYAPSTLRILSQPEDTIANEGDDLTFTIVAEGDNITYKWQQSDDNCKTWKTLTDVTGDTLQTTLTKENNHRCFQCILRDSHGNKVVSKTFSMEYASIVITEQPSPVTAKEGDLVSFKIKATGEGLNYQWQLSDDQGLTWRNSKATVANYSTTLSTTNNGRFLRCIVTDQYGNSVTSQNASMKIAATPLRIISQPEDTIANEGDRLTFTIRAQGDNITYKWQQSDDNCKTWRTLTDVTGNTLSTTLTRQNNHRCFQCILRDSHGNKVVSKTFSMEYASIVITEQPSPVTAKEGDLVSFKIKATGEGLTYQWQLSDDQGKSWRNSKATTPSYSTTLTTANNKRYLRCIVTDQYGNKLKSDATYMKITSLKISGQPVNAEAPKGSKVTFNVTASGPSITYQWQLSDDKGKTWRNSSTKTATYSTTLSDKNDGRYVRCIVTDKYGNSVISNPARMEAA